MSASSRISGLKARPKTDSDEERREIDRIGERRGFTDRSPRRKPGRKASPRTYQLHPKVMPETGAALAAEAERLGLTQGQMIERMWEAYQEEK